MTSATASNGSSARAAEAPKRSAAANEGGATDQTPVQGGGDGSKAAAGAVFQVERRDFTQLVPTDRPRVQSMRGFDPIYTDIVDYIVRCTHRIWD